MIVSKKKLLKYKYLELKTVGLPLQLEVISLDLCCSLGLDIC